jgi:hypothetical protein
MLQKFICISFFFLILQCGKPIPSLEGIDLTKWKADKGACRSERKLYIDALIKQKNRLKGLAESDIIELLGRPDQNELYKRNQKFYYYNIDPGKDCMQADSTQRKLSIRFTAMGIAKDIVIE